MIEVRFMVDESGVAPGEENLSPEERLRIHTARQVVTPENAPIWWEHWVSNAKSVASLLKEKGKVWRPEGKFTFGDVFIAVWIVVFLVAAIWLLAVIT